MGRPPADITGERHGYLVAVKKSEEKRFGSYLWECRCVCGATKLIPLLHYRTGRYKSCGCLQQVAKRKRVTYQGKRYNLDEFAEIVGYSKEWVARKLNRGFSANDIAQKLTLHRKDYGLEHPMTISEIAKKAGVSRQAVSTRVKRGWRGEKLLSPNVQKKEEGNG